MGLDSPDTTPKGHSASSKSKSLKQHREANHDPTVYRGE